MCVPVLHKHIACMYACKLADGKLVLRNPLCCLKSKYGKVSV